MGIQKLVKISDDEFVYSVPQSLKWLLERKSRLGGNLAYLTDLKVKFPEKTHLDNAIVKVQEQLEVINKKLVAAKEAGMDTEVKEA